jgi:hypothetical protein
MLWGFGDLPCHQIENRSGHGTPAQYVERASLPCGATVCTQTAENGLDIGLRAATNCRSHITLPASIRSLFRLAVCPENGLLL